MSLYVKLSEGAIAPKRATEHSAGYDIYCNEKFYINRGERRLVSTGVFLAIPEGHYGRIAPRSGLAVRDGIDIGAGVVDSDYRGEVKVLLINDGDKSFNAEKHTRIAQLIIEKISLPEVKVVTNLHSTDRGSGGFGSTGTN